MNEDMTMKWVYLYPVYGFWLLIRDSGKLMDRPYPYDSAAMLMFFFNPFLWYHQIGVILVYALLFDPIFKII